MSAPSHEIEPGYAVPRQIVGLWQFSEGHSSTPIPREDALDALEQYFEAGFDTFDCADIYTGVEALLGEFRGRLGARAKQLRVHTKYVPDRSALSTLRRQDVEAAIDRSLRRLRTDRLDLVQFAWWDYDVPGYVDVVGWLGELRRAGKIARVGTTNFDVARLREMAATGVPLVSHQVQYSLLDRRPRHHLEAYLQEAGGSMLCYGSLAGGFLSRRWLGVAEPGSAWSNRSLTKYRLIIEEAGGWDAYQELLRSLDEIAASHEVDIPHVASAWVLEQPGVGAVIVGIRSAEHLSDALRAFGVALTHGDRARIHSLLARHRGPAGDTFGLERVPGGPHAAIMWTDLNRARPTSE